LSNHEFLSILEEMMKVSSFPDRVSIPFTDRSEAGRMLGSLLSPHSNDPDLLVLALPRGGVPVAFEVARALNAPLDVFLVRKLGVPHQEELAMGAIATGDVRVLNGEVISELGISSAVIDAITTRERRELERREQTYRDGRSAPRITGRTVILVDDGLATGSTMRAAIAALREQKPSRIIVAVPVAAAESCVELKKEVDEVVCAQTPSPFFAVGRWYRDFSPTMDREIHDLLAVAAS
jgi:predicted phosphoribosyltransferase